MRFFSRVVCCRSSIRNKRKEKKDPGGPPFFFFHFDYPVAGICQVCRRRLYHRRKWRKRNEPQLFFSFMKKSGKKVTKLQPVELCDGVEGNVWQIVVITRHKPKRITAAQKCVCVSLQVIVVRVCVNEEEEPPNFYCVSSQPTQRDVLFFFFFFFYFLDTRDDTTTTRVCSIAIDTFWFFFFSLSGPVDVLDDGTTREKRKRRKVMEQGINWPCLLHPKELEWIIPAAATTINYLLKRTLVVCDSLVDNSLGRIYKNNNNNKKK